MMAGKKPMMLAAVFALAILVAVPRSSPASPILLGDDGPSRPGDVDVRYWLLPGSTCASVGCIPYALVTDAQSSWVTTYGGASDTEMYVYRTVFWLSSAQASNAMIIGQWATDGNPLDMLLNGLSLSVPSLGHFRRFVPFAFDQGFMAGMNTLDFVVGTGSCTIIGCTNPDATWLELQSDTLVTPEPASLLLLASGLAVGRFLRGRSRRDRARPAYAKTGRTDRPV